MQVEAIALRLRPRSMSEATDLGVRLVQAHARSIWSSYAPVLAGVAVVAIASAAIDEWLPILVIFWLKPWLDRTVLFVLSRAVFGQPTLFGDVWRAQRQVWWAQLPATLTWRRLSPWRSVVAPAQQLEGQRGAAARARRRQLLKGQQLAASGMHAVFANLEGLLYMGAMLLGVMFLPDDMRPSGWGLFGFDDSAAGGYLPGLLYAVIVLFLEPFYVGAGFAMYLNRRVELEAWDLEQEFRIVFAA